MAKRKNLRYICPCCYGNIDLGQIHYACRNPACSGTFLKSSEETGTNRYASEYKPDEEVDVEKSEFLGLDPKGPAAITTKYHIIRGSSDGKCDQCGSKDTVRLCPRCHKPLTECAEEFGTTIFAITGSEGTGKSHYVATVIDRLKNSYSAEFGVEVTASSERSEKKYSTEYYKPVYLDCRCLPPTPSYGEDSSRDPLLYDIKKDGETIRTLAFVDTCGKDLDSNDKLASLNVSTYIADASGIVFVIDPLQVPSIRKGLGLPETECLDLTKSLEYVAEVIRDRNKIKPKSRIDTQLAVVITKSDLLVKSASGNIDEDILFGPESSLHIEREKGQPDLDNIAQIGTEVEEYLRRTIGQEFLDVVEMFRNHEFFAVSALGGETDEGALLKAVDPYRVEDPIIWFLNHTERRGWF